jgi:hypothetical protein
VLPLQQGKLNAKKPSIWYQMLGFLVFIAPSRQTIGLDVMA